MVENQLEHRREPSGGSDNVVCSEEEENDSVDNACVVSVPSNVGARASLNDDDSFSSATSSKPSPPMIRGNQIRIENVPDLLK